MRHTIAMVVGCLLAATLSQCARADSWTGQDKAHHVAMTAAMAKLTAQTHGGATGIVLAMAPGVAKEISDLSGSGTPSVRDLTANLLGALVGSALPKRYMLAPMAPAGVIDGVMLTFSSDL